MGKTADCRGPEGRPDPVRSFNRWKKKHSHKQSQKKQLRKQLKKPEWQVERESISRLMQNYEKVGRGRGVGGPRGWGGTCGGRPPIPGARRRSTGLQKGGGERGPEEAPRRVTWVPQTRPVDRPGRSSARHAVPDEVRGMHFGVRR